MNAIVGATRTLALSAESVTPELASRFAGVGMVRGEYVMRRERAHISTGRAQEALRSYLDHVAATFAPKPVWYRLNDLDVAEAAVLDGHDDEEIEDPIRLLGTRGVRRAMRFPAAFDREMGVVADVQARRPNIGVLFPFVTEPEEVRWAIDRSRRAGARGPFAMMAEIPAAVLTLEAFVDVGIERVMLGCNDLWSLTMGSVRGASSYAPLAPGMRRMIESARASTAGTGVTLAMGGYLTADHLRAADELGVDEVVAHYRDAADLFDLPASLFPDRDVVPAIKAWTRAAVEDRGYRFEAFTLPRNRVG